jgi:class 3 adenylate cyclase
MTDPSTEGSSRRLRRRHLLAPEARRDFPRHTGYIVQLGSVAIGRAELQPGWRWSQDIAPITGTASCQVHHLQLLLAGRLGVRMDDGEEGEFGPGDVFEVPPGHDAWVIGDEVAVVLDVYGNVADFAVPASEERVLTTILMTDIVDSTATAERLGDARWKQALANHDRLVRAQLARFRGREVTTTGDGFLATFDSPVAALRAGDAIADACASIDLPARVGVHTGEVSVVGEDVRGLAVHAAARIMALGGPSEVLASAATRALAEGSGLSFEPAGRHNLKGIEAPMDVFRLRGR